jgi:bacteriorhodopsin
MLTAALLCSVSFWIVALEGRRQAKRLGSDIHRTYLICGVWTLFVWICYPVSWGVSESGKVNAPDSEAVFYAVLDICAKPVSSIMLIAGNCNIDPGRIGLRIEDYDSNHARFGPQEKTSGQCFSRGDHAYINRDKGRGNHI